MIRAVNFLTPSLHPNTLLDISYPEPGPSSHEPLVRNVTIKHGDHQPVGHIKRVITFGIDTVGSDVYSGRYHYAYHLAGHGSR